MTVKGNVSGLRDLLSICCGVIIGMVYLSINFNAGETDFEDASTFGASTTTIMAKDGEYPIHCGDTRDIDGCLAGIKHRNVQHSAVWLGNSQLHAVNQWHSGELNAAPRVFSSVKSLGLDLITLSQPNASLQEHLLLYTYLSYRLPLELVVLPVVFDDAREDGIRGTLISLLDDTKVQDSMKVSEIGRTLLQKGKDIRDEKHVDDMAGINDTFQKKVEGNLNDWLQNHSKLWGARPEIRGQLFSVLYRTRNEVFGINPTTKRRKINSRYKANVDALEAVLKDAEKKNIKVLVYIAPLRNDIDVPYVATEYEQFKSDVSELAGRHGAHFENLEDLIPGEFWGSKQATSLGTKDELDFMHFQAGGHRLLAEKLSKIISDMYR